MWTSPRIRAKITAELAGLPVHDTVADLAEWDYGDYEGLTTPQIRERVADWSVWTHGAPGGESVAALTARVDRLVARVRAAQDDGDVVLVAHGHLGRALLARYLGQPVGSGGHCPSCPPRWRCSASITTVSRSCGSSGSPGTRPPGTGTPDADRPGLIEYRPDPLVSIYRDRRSC